MARPRRKIPDDIRAILKDNLWGPSEVAAELGIKLSNLYGKNTPAGMPEPIAKIKGTTIWLADEIREFARERERRRRPDSD